jgi:acetolactate synthase-1/2/3 large subunit
VDESALRHFEGSEEEKQILAQEKPAYDEALTAQILEKISKAERPVMIVGEGIRFAGVKDKMLKVCDMLKIPVVTAWNAHDLVADDNPYYCGRPGTVGTRGGNFVMQGSDLIISLGCRLNIRQISYNFAGWSPDAYKIMVDIDEAELNKPTIKIDMKVHADVTDVLDSIIASGFDGGDAHAEWLKWSRDVDAKYPACIPSYEQSDQSLCFHRQILQGACGG